jgi:MFS family permease
MTGADQYNPYLVSRYFAGFFGMVVSVLGPRYLVDLFFLHQRGRAFTILHLALNFGASAGPTFSGYIAANHSWTIEYWWSVGLLSLTAISVFLFLEETGFDRTEGSTNISPPDNFVKNRIYTFFPGTKIVKPTTLTETVRALSRKRPVETNNLRRRKSQSCHSRSGLHLFFLWSLDST